VTFLVPAAVKCPIERTGQIKRSTWRQRIADATLAPIVGAGDMSSEKPRLRSQWSSMLLMPKLKPL